MANLNNPRSQLLSLAAASAVIALCYWLDTISIHWRRTARASFQLQPYYFFTLALMVLFAALMLLVAWVLLIRFRQAWPALTVELLAGAGITAFGAALVSGSPAMLPLIDLSVFTWLRTAIFGLGSASLTLQAGAFLLVISAANLIRRLR